MKKSRKLKLFKMTLLIIFVIGLFWSGVWWMNYQKYMEKVSNEYKKYGQCYGKETEAIYYTISCPSFASLVGNYGITDCDNNISIIIWPDYIGKVTYTYGLELADKKTEVVYRFYVDENMEYMDSNEDTFSDKEKHKIIRLLEGNRKEIEELLSDADEEWGLNIT